MVENSRKDLASRFPALSLRVIASRPKQTSKYPPPPVNCFVSYRMGKPRCVHANIDTASGGREKMGVSTHTDGGRAEMKGFPTCVLSLSDRLFFTSRFSLAALN